MDKNYISIARLNGLVVSVGKHSNRELAATMNANIMALGYMFDESLFNAVASLTEKQATRLYNDIVPILKRAVGAHVVHKPMYPNFPKQVMEASEMELFINAILHYWTFGQWKPEYEAAPRLAKFEKVKYKMLTLGSEEDFVGVFKKILSSNDSVSETDRNIVEWFYKHYDTEALPYPDIIPFKENMCVVAGMFLADNIDISLLVTNATDVLRIVTYLSDGDISLATNTKFRSLPKAQRRILVRALEGVINEEDIARHSNKWIKLAHNLHVGDFSQKVYDIIKKARENQKIETFNARVDAVLETGKVRAITALLKERPSEFARRLDHVLRLTNESPTVVKGFCSVVDQVSSRVLLQVLGHLQTRNKRLNERVVYPKGQDQKAMVVHTDFPRLKADTLKTINTAIHDSLGRRFENLDKLGNVWIDPNLMSCPLPTAQRSASESLHTVARGTAMPIGDKKALRFFIYWVGQDIDLSATFHDENFMEVAQVSYTRLRDSAFESCHSGDITYAPSGASEFIDVNIDSAVSNGARYVVMNVYVYAGPNFSAHDECFAGWMARDHVDSNEIYDPKTVEGKIDLTSNSRNAIPVVFDLVERKAIWADLTTSSLHRNRVRHGGNNVHAQRATTEQNLKAIVTSANKVTLYELFKMHAKARGKIVKDPTKADTVFSLHEGITPYDINTINSEFVV